MFVVCGHSFGLATGDPFREGAHVRKGGCPELKEKYNLKVLGEDR
jgi:hypothetical protein